MTTLPIKRLTPSEMEGRREKRLCYNCESKFTPRHRCRTSHFLCLLVERDDDSKMVAEMFEVEPLPYPFYEQQQDTMYLISCTHWTDGASYTQVHQIHKRAGSGCIDRWRLYQQFYSNMVCVTLGITSSIIPAPPCNGQNGESVTYGSTCI